MSLYIRIYLFVSIVVLAGSVSAQQPPAPESETSTYAEAAVVARATLTGITINAEGEPVVGAYVELSEAGVSTVSGADGTFRFLNLAPGLVTVSVISEDYYSAEAHQVELTPGGEVYLEVELLKQAIVEETIVVTGTGTEYLASEAPVRTELITTEVVEKQIKTTLSEALTATIPGVRIEMNCQNCGFTQLRMNGLEGPYTQILEDGLPNYSGVAAVYGLEQIPTAFVEQIEVVKGGNSALYGPSAVAGVVNLIRREPRENRFRFDTQMGWQAGRPEQQAGAAAQLIDLPGGFSGDFFYRGINRVAIDRDRDGYSDLSKRRLNSGGGSLFHDFLDERVRLSVNGTIAEEFRRGGGQFDLPPHESWLTEQIDSRRSTISARWNHSPTAKTFYSLKTSFADYYRDTYYGALRDPNAYGSTSNPLWVNDVQAGHQAGRHSFLAGYQYSRDEVSDRIPAYNRQLGGIFTDHGVYLQDEFRIAPHLVLLGGVRMDKSNQIDHWILSPRAGLRLGLTQDITWRVSVSTGFRAPAIFDEDLHVAAVGGDGFVIQNGPGISEEKSLSLSSGLDFVGQWGGRRLQLGGNFFWTDLSDNYQLRETSVEQGGYRLFHRINGPGSYVRGVDFNGNVQLTPAFSVRGGASFQVARYDQPEDQFSSLDFFRTPDRYGFIGFDWDLPADIEFLGTADFTGPMLVPHYAGYIPDDVLETSQSFAVFNFVVSRVFSITDQVRMRLFLNAGNVSDSYQPDLDRGPMRDSGYVYGPAAMRQFTIGATWEF